MKCRVAEGKRVLTSGVPVLGGSEAFSFRLSLFNIYRLPSLEQNNIGRSRNVLTSIVFFCFKSASPQPVKFKRKAGSKMAVTWGSALLFGNLNTLTS